MLVKTEAFVLRKYAFGETSWIVHLFTRETGKVKGVCKGVRQLKSRRLSHFDAPALLQVEYYDKANRDLQLLADSFLLNFFNPIKASLPLYLHASYALELVEGMTQGHMASDILFRVLRTYLMGLKPTNMGLFTLAFMVKLLKTLGIFPNLLECAACGRKIERRIFFSFQQGGGVCDRAACFDGYQWNETLDTINIELIFQLIRRPFEEIERELCEKVESKTLLSIMMHYLDYLHHGNLKTVKVLRDILEVDNPLASIHVAEYH